MPHNPFAKWPITNGWAGHASYSAGGDDYPTPYGYAFEAPAAGTLRISGGSGEFQAGKVGSAGRRSILELDTPLPRIGPRQPSPPEGEGPMVAIVFQHQAEFGAVKHYNEGDPRCGVTGASANGLDWGGDVHMHTHGLNAAGQRLRISNYITGAQPSGGTTNPVTNQENDMTLSFIPEAGKATIRLLNYGTGLSVPIGSPYHMTLLQRSKVNNGGDPMLLGELHIVENYMRTVSEPDVNVGAILAKIDAVAVKPETIAAAIKAQGLTVNAKLSDADVQAAAKTIAAEVGKTAVTIEAITAAIQSIIHEGITVDATVDDEQLDAASERLAKLIGIRIAGGNLAGVDATP